ncbi:hypothetical protein GCM10009583_08890 [Ornithinicoccus hortensis]|uniref:Serine protease Do n=1 Tax=Ornithinicoccus hortensis TaxID=82346 RepID=A0A542YQM9_9MICO|nr:serine protease Do [Ornithinicoccus hortensis]
MNRTRRLAPALTLPIALALGACAGGAPETATPQLGSGGGTQVQTIGDGTDSTAGPDGDDADRTEGPDDGGGIARFDEAQPAVIQIIASGTLRDPEVGLTTTAGSGSGFLISEDGLAVTNNHVVTGAGTLEVYIGGDTSTSYNATVLGASECSDLALIRVDVDGAVPYLRWSDDEVVPGLDVYAAGFPLGDPEYTLTKGIVSKAKANGDITGSSSIAHTIEHDATIQPGNSGGPLISVDGEVVAVNFAGGALREGASNQFWAIAADLAQPMVESLGDGDVESLGINGWPVFDDQLAISGIWVAGVKAGSPAARAGLLPGDIVLTLNGMPMAQQGTYAEYCDVVRTSGHNTLSVEVLRWDTAQVLRGEINGDLELEPILSLAEEVGDEVAGGGGEDTPAPPDEEGVYETVVDDTGSIQVDVPVRWNDRETSSDNSPEGWPFIGASDDMAAFRAGWTHPGLVFYLRPYQGHERDILSHYTYEDVCAEQVTEEFSDAMYRGLYQIWSDCQDTDGLVVTLLASDHDQTYTAVMVTYVATEQDLEALDRAFASFSIF